MTPEQQQMRPRPMPPADAQTGLSLLELGLSMMILAILSVGVSSLVKSGVEAQMARRVHQQMQVVALNIVDDIRQDMRTACSASIQNGGSRLVIDQPPCAAASAPTQADITYERTSGNDFVRIAAGGAQKLYNDPNVFPFRLNVDCQNVQNGSTACFETSLLNNDPAPKAKQVQINALRVYQDLPVGGGTMIDHAFGLPNFVVRQMSFDVMGATEFQ